MNYAQAYERTLNSITADTTSRLSLLRKAKREAIDNYNLAVKAGDGKSAKMWMDRAREIDLEMKKIREEDRNKKIQANRSIRNKMIADQTKAVAIRQQQIKDVKAYRIAQAKIKKAKAMLPTLRPKDVKKTIDFIKKTEAYMRSLKQRWAKNAKTRIRLYENISEYAESRNG